MKTIPVNTISKAIKRWYRWQTNVARLARSGGSNGVLKLDVTLAGGDELKGMHAPQEIEVYSQLHYTLLISILLTATHAILQDSLPKDPEPYHTSALTGEEWVIEPIVGHPECIRCELGVRADVFQALVTELHALGHTNSRYVSLEEQLAIFLYTCVTGLTIRHVGERFQRSNDTISRY